MTVWRFVNGKIAEEWVFFNDLECVQSTRLAQRAGIQLIIMDERTAEQTPVEAVLNVLTLPDEEPKPRR